MGAAACCFGIPAVGRFYKHDSPYTYFTSKELHLGEISLECSRAGAAAVAFWATQKLAAADAGRGVCPRAGAGTARGAGVGSAAAGRCAYGLSRFEAWADRSTGDLDIVVWKLKAADPDDCVRAGRRSVFAACARAQRLHLALVQLPQFWFGVSSGERRSRHVPSVGADEAGT